MKKTKITRQRFSELHKMMKYISRRTKTKIEFVLVGFNGGRYSMKIDDKICVISRTGYLEKAEYFYREHITWIFLKYIQELISGTDI